LQNAASIAGLLITTEAMVAERPKKESAAPAMPVVVWVVWGVWTINLTHNRSDEGPGFLPGLFSVPQPRARTRGWHQVSSAQSLPTKVLRGIALGHKSWLFAGSDRGGERAALMLTLIAKLNDVDSQGHPVTG
jgi:hypothetical protein